MAERSFAAAVLIFASAFGSFQARGAPAPTQTFDWNPVPLGLDGKKFTADTISLSDFGQIVVNPVTGTFSEAGYLPILGFSLAGRSIRPTGFNDPTGWGAFVRYQAAGTQALTPTGLVATYSSLSYSLVGFNGVATYGLDTLTGVAYESGGTNQTLLGDGQLITGSLTLAPTAFVGGVPAQFAVSGTVQATIGDVPNPFSSNTLLGFTLNVVHPPGEVFPISRTVFEADGGSSSTASLLAGRGNSSHARTNSLLAVAAPAAVAVSEPASEMMLGVGVLSLIGLRQIRRRKAG